MAIFVSTIRFRFIVPIKFEGASEWMFFFLWLHRQPAILKIMLPDFILVELILMHDYLFFQCLLLCSLGWVKIINFFYVTQLAFIWICIRVANLKYFFETWVIMIFGEWIFDDETLLLLVFHAVRVPAFALGLQWIFHLKNGTYRKTASSPRNSVLLSQQNTVFFLKKKLINNWKQ